MYREEDADGDMGDRGGGGDSGDAAAAVIAVEGTCGGDGRGTSRTTTPMRMPDRTVLPRPPPPPPLAPVTATAECCAAVGVAAGCAAGSGSSHALICPAPTGLALPYWSAHVTQNVAGAPAVARRQPSPATEQLCATATAGRTWHVSGVPIGSPRSRTTASYAPAQKRTKRTSTRPSRSALLRRTSPPASAAAPPPPAPSRAVAAAAIAVAIVGVAGASVLVVGSSAAVDGEAGGASERGRSST